MVKTVFDTAHAAEPAMGLCQGCADRSGAGFGAQDKGLFLNEEQDQIRPVHGIGGATFGLHAS